MKNNLRGLAEGILFALNIFLAFLILFESKVVIPQWLQPIGRMHPMILHFPIALLLLAMFLEFFRFRSEYSGQKFYQNFTSGLLLFITLAAAVTAIMGIFLAKEEGYTGKTLLWHKWAGVSVVFLASIIYFYRHADWYKAPVAKTGAVLVSVGIILTGHFGATLTHGENFILGPVLAQHEQVNVPVDQAMVFAHVVKPIFDRKCISCHNQDKAKGGLILEEPELIVKGGKTGKLFKPGDPELSLLLERINLPLEEEEHMPPSGKQQLTPEEKELLHLWVQSGADFQQKIIELPYNDSLREIASTILWPAENSETKYKFAAADHSIIQKLNAGSRFVSPLSRESPALVVNFFNQKEFTPEALDELNAVKTQIVSLDLNNMPVNDSDLKKVSQFENLRKLSLNFTGISGEGLAELASLKFLNNLSLSGTNVNYQDLQRQLPAFKSLNKLVIWNTKLNGTEISKLQNSHKNILIIAGFEDDGSNPVKLNVPQLKNKSNIFRDSLLLNLDHPIKGVEIRYTTDGSEPDSVNSPVFTPETVLKEYTLIKARAYKDGWYGSDVETFDVYKSKYKPDTVILLTPLNRVHPANGSKNFFDEELGTFNANSPAWANNWAGYLKNDMELLLEYKEPVTISSIALNTLIETETIIFPPSSIEVWGGDTKGNLRLITTIRPEQPAKESKPFIKLIEGKFKPQKVSYLKIIAKPLNSIPNWHNNKGKQSLLLVDEIFIN
jgi:uncharacterized membrane protein